MVSSEVVRPIKLKSREGIRYGRLVVLRFSGILRRKSLWECSCDCGIAVTVLGNSLQSGATQSCGCLRAEIVKTASIKHGDTHFNLPKTREYHSWDAMKQRVTNPKARQFKNYGGRGVSICDRWMNSYSNFLKDMGRCPKGCSLDRINNSGNYEPGNCRWATHIQQGGNKRTCRYITRDGKTMCASAWSRETGIGRMTILRRLNNGLNPSIILCKKQPQ